MFCPDPFRHGKLSQYNLTMSSSPLFAQNHVLFLGQWKTAWSKCSGFYRKAVMATGWRYFSSSDSGVLNTPLTLRLVLERGWLRLLYLHVSVPGVSTASLCRSGVITSLPGNEKIPRETGRSFLRHKETIKQILWSGVVRVWDQNGC